MNRKPIFDAVRRLLGRSFASAEVDELDAAIDAAAAEPAPAGRSVGAKGIALLHKFEGCARQLPDGRIASYPDPGSKDGKPWTIGWGSTGPDIGPKTVWTQAQCDARFEADLVRYAKEVSAALGDAPTTQDQFDAMVSFHYNTGKITSATLTRRHKDGDHKGAALEFEKWVFNDGKRMEGLARRRAAEAALYKGAAV